MSDPYANLTSALANDGTRCQFQAAGQLVISRQVGSIWPDRGNSFWVTHVGGRWYLFTWSPVGYRVPDSVDFGAVCRACIAFGNSAMYRVPREIAEPFGLIELSEEEADAVAREMGDGDRQRMLGSLPEQRTPNSANAVVDPFVSVVTFVRLIGQIARRRLTSGGRCGSSPFSAVGRI